MGKMHRSLRLIDDGGSIADKSARKNELPRTAVFENRLSGIESIRLIGGETQQEIAYPLVDNRKGSADLAAAKGCNDVRGRSLINNPNLSRDLAGLHFKAAVIHQPDGLNFIGGGPNAIGHGKV